MAECRKCGKNFHACPSCGLWGWEWDYCQQTCYEAGVTEAQTALRLILGDLSDDQKAHLKTWADDYTFCKEDAIERYLDIQDV